MTETSLASIIAHVVVGTGDPNKTLLNLIKRKENNLIITEKKPTNNEPRKLMTGITQEAVKIEVDKILTEIGMEKHKEWRSLYLCTKF